MSLLRIKNADGTWFHIPAINGKPGKDGAIQYVAGDGIKIEDNIISAKTNVTGNIYSTKLSSDKQVYQQLINDYFNGINSLFEFVGGDHDGLYYLCDDKFSGQLKYRSVRQYPKKSHDNATGTTSNRMWFKAVILYYDLETHEYTGNNWASYNDGVITDYLDTSQDYTTPYKPKYDGSPVNKKYVNDIVGNKDELKTDNKQLVGAINEIFNNASNFKSFVCDEEIFNMREAETGIYTFTSNCKKIITLSSDITNGEGLSSYYIYLVNSGGNKYAVVGWYRNSTVGMRLWFEFVKDGVDKAVKQEVSVYDYLTISSNQNITGIKTFMTLPKSTVVPTDDSHLVNKKYVDETVGNISTILETLTTVEGETE